MFLVLSVPDRLLCSEDEIHTLLSSLDVSKANGPDGISARMLHSTALAITPSVTKLVNLSISCGRPPSQWKMSSVVPIPKISRAVDVKHFRPISLLPILSKVLERHISFLIYDHLERTCPLNNCQWGFQPGKSTVSALLCASHDWFVSLERRLDVGAIFFDLRKAFDTVPHSLLLSKLVKIGLDPFIVTWIHNYLAERRQSVVLHGVSSLPADVISGVPQGSVLGPLLFLIFIDDIAAVQLSDGSRLVLFADDILLYHPISCSDDYLCLQSDIDSIGAWVTSNGMSLNYSKCKFMRISRKSKPISKCSPLLLDGAELEEVTTFKYLGILISSNLSWTPHIQTVCGNARKIIGLLYRRYYHHCDSSVLVRLYTSLVRPHMEYASSVWNPHHLHDIDRMESVQKFALRMCSKHWDAGYSELLNAFELSSLENRRLYFTLCHLFKIVHGLCVFPSDIFVPLSTLSHHSQPHMLHQPFCRTDSYFHSFVPSSIRHWNNLPSEVVHASTLVSFKSALRVFT